MDALQTAGALLLVALSVVGLVIGARDERRQHRAEVWSRHGTPRTVAIGYPRGGWAGQAPWSIALYLLWTGIVSAFLLFLVVNIAGPGPWTTAGRIALAAGAVGGLGGGVLTLLSYLGSRAVEGPVLHRRIVYGEDGGPIRYLLAVDDGRSTTLRGFVTTRSRYGAVVSGAHVRLTVTPVLRHVSTLTVLTLPGSVNGFPGEFAPLFPDGLTGLAVTGPQAAAALDGAVEPFAAPPAVDGPDVRAYGYVLCGIPATEPRLHCVLVHEARGAGAAERLAALPRDTAHVQLPDRAVAVQVRYEGLTRSDLARLLAGQARRAARRG